MPAPWKPDSWRGKPILQVPEYPDQAVLESVEGDLRNFPPLVFVKEVRDLKARLAAVSEGQGFLLQGGDCAESFKEHKTDYIRDYFQLFLQMALILTFKGNSQVVKVGRVAGQFAKPRSSPTEKQGDKELPSYRGDIVNGPEFTPEARIPDPRRQLQAYRQSAATLNFLRALLDGGYASLENAHRWELKFMEGTPVEARYEALADEIKRTVEINALLGMTAEKNLEMRTTSFYTSHEALLLPYEQALTRRDEAMGSGEHVATSGHLLWIGDRTRQADGAHIEFCRGIVNPIGMKCGPSLEARRPAALDRDPEPQGRAGTADADLPLRRRQDRQAPAEADPGRAEGRSQGGVVVRSDARQHGHGGHRLQDAALREHRQRGGAVLRHPSRRGQLSRRRAHRDDRPERHRMHRWRQPHLGSRPRPPVRYGLRPAPQRRAGAGVGISAGGAAEAAEGWDGAAPGRRRVGRCKRDRAPHFVFPGQLEG